MRDEDLFLAPKSGNAALHVDVPWDADVRISYKRANGLSPVSEWTLSRGKYRNFLLRGLPTDRDNLTAVTVIAWYRKDDGQENGADTKTVYVMSGDRRYLRFGDTPDVPKVPATFVAAPAAVAPAAAPAQAGPSVEFNSTALTANIKYKGDEVEHTTDQGKDVWSGITFPANPVLILYHNHHKPIGFMPAKQTAQFTIRMFLATEANHDQPDQQKEVAITKTWDIEFTYEKPDKPANADLPGKCNLSAAAIDLVEFLRPQIGGALSAKDKISAVRVEGYVQFDTIVVNAQNGQTVRVSGDSLQTTQPLWITFSPAPK
ncbi:MAG TPA: hypothetical protein VG826_36280 [Pirellulales bacterium]|nr:hypothetical protein [Pirellulales bacterium]